MSHAVAANTRGLVVRPPRPYLHPVNFFSRFSPFRATRDLRLYLAQRKRYELFAMFGAVVLTVLVIAGFVVDSRVEIPYQRHIIYVQSWPLDRSDKEIVTQQKVDMDKKAKEEAELQKALKERQAKFKKIDDALKRWGI